MASPAAPVHHKKHGEGTTGSAGSSGIPCAMVLTVSFLLSLGTGLYCPHRRADRIRATWHQRRDARTTRLRRPRYACARLAQLTRPPQSRLTCRDDRDAPLFIEAGWRGKKHTIPKNGSKIFSQQGGTVETALHRIANVRFFARVIFPAETARDCIARARNCPTGESLGRRSCGLATRTRAHKAHMPQRSAAV
jgi:hypothetical protein